MKPNRGLSFSVAMILISGILHAQEDSIKIQRINVHGIVNGKQTSGYYTKNQKTLTMDEQLIREINFNDSTKQIQDYTFYFYRDGRLFSEENYNQRDSLQWIITHTYNTQGQEVESGTLTWTGGKPVQSLKTVFKYDAVGNIILKKEFFTVKKSIATTQYFYSSDRLDKEQYKHKKSPDPVTSRSVTYQYFPDGKLKQREILEKNRNKSTSAQTESYVYDAKGNLEKTEIRDSGGQIILIKNYVYYPEGGLYRYYEQNKEGNMLCYHTYAYRKHKVDLGTQKSYFDKP